MLDERFAGWVESGSAAGLAELFATDALLDALVFGRRIRASGSGSILQELGTWWEEPGRIGAWHVETWPSGLLIDFERSWEDGGGLRLYRQRHYIQTADGLVTRQQVYSCRPFGAEAGIELEPLPPAVAAELGRFGEIAGREPISHSGQSGSRIEHVRFADGSAVVFKQVWPDSFLSRVSHDRGRELALWRSGIFDRVPRAIDHAVLAAGEERDVVPRHARRHRGAAAAGPDPDPRGEPPDPRGRGRAARRLLGRAADRGALPARGPIPLRLAGDARARGRRARLHPEADVRGVGGLRGNGAGRRRGGRLRDPRRSGAARADAPGPLRDHARPRRPPRSEHGPCRPGGRAGLGRLHEGPARHGLLLVPLRQRLADRGDARAAGRGLRRDLRRAARPVRSSSATSASFASTAACSRTS